MVSATEDVVEMVKDRTGCYDDTGEKVIRPVKNTLTDGPPAATWEWEVVARHSAFLKQAAMTPTESPEPYPDPVELAERVIYNDGFPRLVYNNQRKMKNLLIRTTLLILVLILCYLYYLYVTK